MTRKDYIAFAKAFNAGWKYRLHVMAETQSTVGKSNMESHLNGYRDAIRHTVDVLQADNPAFDRVRFLEACFKED